MDKRMEGLGMLGSVDKRSLPNLRPGFDSRTIRLTWIEFVVGSPLAPRVFLRVLRFSSLHKKQHFLNSSSITTWTYCGSFYLKSLSYKNMLL